jgi:hypothetical protein
MSRLSSNGGEVRRVGDFARAKTPRTPSSESFIFLCSPFGVARDMLASCCLRLRRARVWVMPPERQEPYQQQCDEKSLAIIYLRLWKIVTAAKKARRPLPIVGKKENLTPGSADI